MTRLSPSLRMSLGLALLTVTVLLAAGSFGLIPSRSEGIVEGREKFCESLAIQCAIAAEREDFAAVQATIRMIAARNEDVLSVAIRAADGTVLAQTGGHAELWGESGTEPSPTHARVPIFRDKTPWGQVEVRFAEIAPGGAFGAWMGSIGNLVLFVALAGFLAYMLFLRKTLRYLDPSSVVPTRVKSALDTLAEGVLLLDVKERIVLANAAFAEQVNRPAEALLGRKASDLDWTSPPSHGRPEAFPWSRALQESGPRTGVPLALGSTGDGVRRFAVNAAPIFDARGQCRGVLATFDDVTRLEEKNDQLQEMLGELEGSRAEIHRQNEELRRLATEDPLTGCLNRRTLFDQLESDLAAARPYDHHTSCIMADIDFFKPINDRYGHVVGDQVLRCVAEALKAASRARDIVCRYGGEEFCILLPQTDLAGAAQAAERLRQAVLAMATTDVRVTASFGVSSAPAGAADAGGLIRRADEALYHAKRTGRNRTVCWSEDLADVT